MAQFDMLRSGSELYTQTTPNPCCAPLNALSHRRVTFTHRYMCAWSSEAKHRNRTPIVSETHLISGGIGDTSMGALAQCSKVIEYRRCVGGREWWRCSMASSLSCSMRRLPSATSTLTSSPCTALTIDAHHIVLRTISDIVCRHQTGCVCMYFLYIWRMHCSHTTRSTSR